jgi:RHS repeat-associated protein
VGGGETRDYYYDFNWRSVEERVGTPGSQTVKAQYTWSPTDRWTMIRRKRSTTGTLNEVLYVLKDYLDPAALLAPGSPNATVVERFGFDAFGPVRFMTEAFGSRGNSEYDWNFLFHAEFMDQESGLYNYGYRYYQVNLGRWLSRDPLGEQDGGNIYAMNRNAAVDQLDYLGREFIPPPGNGPKESPTRDRAFGFTSLPQLDIFITCVKCTNNCYRLNKNKFDVTIKRSLVFTKEYNARTRQNVDLPRSIIDAIKAHEQRHIDDARRFHDAWNKALENMLKGGCAFKEEQECKDSARAIENGVKEGLNALKEGPGMHEPTSEWPDVEIIQNKIDEFKRGLKTK